MKKFLYSLRRWLFKKLAPEKMCVYVFKNAEYTTIYDDATKQVWGLVYIDWAQCVYTFTETCNAREWMDQIPPCNDPNCQNCGK